MKLQIALLTAMTFAFTACTRPSSDAFEAGLAASPRHDHETTFGEFKQAAENGHIEAPVHLADMYYRGAYTPQDYVLACD